jgi:hypothetical protein
MTNDNNNNLLIIKYDCDVCNYHTSNKKYYNKHLLTAKHNKNNTTTINENPTNNDLKLILQGMQKITQQIKKKDNIIIELKNDIIELKNTIVLMKNNMDNVVSELLNFNSQDIQQNILAEQVNNDVPDTTVELNDTMKHTFVAVNDDRFNKPPSLIRQFKN